MLQESVYIKLFHNACNIASKNKRLKNIAPVNGIIYTLKTSLNVFEELNTIRGKDFNFNLFASDFIYI